MKILITTTYYLPNISGITIYINILAEQLAKKGHKVTILTSHHDLSSKSTEVIKGFKIKRLWSPVKFGKGLIMPFFPISVVKEIISSDVINCHLPSLESFFVAFGKLILKKRLIVTYHCDFDSGIKTLNKLIQLIQSFVLKMSDKIVVNTTDYIENYGLLKQYRNKIVEIFPPTIIKQVNYKDKNEIDKKLDDFKNKKIVGFLGRISKEKNLELLVEAISILEKEIDFVTILAGPDKVIGEDNYGKKIDNLLSKNNVIKIGEIKNVGAFLKRCECLVVPSNNRLESFGIVQIEAIKNNTPCVVGDLPGIRVVVLKTGMGELFQPNNPNDLAVKIKKVLTNGKSFYKAKSKNLEMFDYKKTIDKYEKLFLT